jgi:hypothetical protein
VVSGGPVPPRPLSVTAAHGLLRDANERLESRLQKNSATGYAVSLEGLLDKGKRPVAWSGCVVVKSLCVCAQSG